METHGVHGLCHYAVSSLSEVLSIDIDVIRLGIVFFNLMCYITLQGSIVNELLI